MPPVFRRACRVGGGATLVPGVTIGEDAYVDAGAVITRDVGDGEVVMGVPARVVGTVSEAELLQHQRRRGIAPPAARRTAAVGDTDCTRTPVTKWARQSWRATCQLTPLRELR
jgi:tetrahydrodipicolinate N-succinyltransferase